VGCVKEDRIEARAGNCHHQSGNVTKRGRHSLTGGTMRDGTLLAPCKGNNWVPVWFFFAELGAA